ncbi:MAG: hypothetical protein MK033_05965 [Candidatus Caenarcaniphilales bacterium]|nr:hypothetical protein [Candidatus Caenarcaniphilales bacterium]
MKNISSNSTAQTRVYKHIVLDHTTPQTELYSWLDKLFKFKQQFYISEDQTKESLQQNKGFFTPGLKVPSRIPVIGNLNFNPGPRKMASRLLQNSKNQDPSLNKIYIVADQEDNIYSYVQIASMDKRYANIAKNLAQKRASTNPTTTSPKPKKNEDNSIINKIPILNLVVKILNASIESESAIFKELINFASQNPDKEIKTACVNELAKAPNKISASREFLKVFKKIQNDLIEAGITHLFAGQAPWQ